MPIDDARVSDAAVEVGAQGTSCSGRQRGTAIRPPTKKFEQGEITIVKSEPLDDALPRGCSAATSQAPPGTSSGLLGSWRACGHDTSCFFHPALELLLVLDDVLELRNDVPPLMTQGCRFELQLASVFVVTNCAIEFVIIDGDGADVTDMTCRVLRRDAPSAVITLDDDAPRPQVFFQVDVTRFKLDGDCCELRIVLGISHLERSCVLTSKPIIVRRARVQQMHEPERLDPLSLKYWTGDVLEPRDKPRRGLTDPGRSNVVLRSASGYGRLRQLEREVLVVDLECDEQLRRVIALARRTLLCIADTRARLHALMWLVSAYQSDAAAAVTVASASTAPKAPHAGTECQAIQTRRALVSASTVVLTAAAAPVPASAPAPGAAASPKAQNRRRRGVEGPALGTAKRGRDHDGNSGGSGSGVIDSSAEGSGGSSHLAAVPASLLSLGASAPDRGFTVVPGQPGETPTEANVVLLGRVRGGLCRHRALLFKLLADEVHVDCFLVRGTYDSTGAAAAARGSSGDNDDQEHGERHTWNVVQLGKETLLVDTMLFPEAPFPWPDARYHCTAALPRAGAAAGDGGSGGSNMRPVAPVLHTPLHHSVAQLDDVVRPKALVHVREECGRGANASVRRGAIGKLVCAVKCPRTHDDEAAVQWEYLVLQEIAETFHCRAASPSSAKKRDGNGRPAEQQHVKSAGSMAQGRGCATIVLPLGFYNRWLLLEYVAQSLLGFTNMLVLRQQRVSDVQIHAVLSAVAVALAVTHAHGFVHRDVKAENVLVTVVQCRACISFGLACDRCVIKPKLADFADCIRVGPRMLLHDAAAGGASAAGDAAGGGGGRRRLEDCSVHVVTPSDCDVAPPAAQRAGTAPYAAPELERQAAYSYKADVWSVGVLAVELFNMQLPRSDDATCNSYVGEGRERVAIPTMRRAPGGREPPAWLAALVEKCLQPEWTRRAPAAELVHDLAQVVPQG